MKQISVDDYAQEAKISPHTLRRFIKKFGLKPVNALNKEFYDYHALRRIYPLCKQLGLFTF